MGVIDMEGASCVGSSGIDDDDGEAGGTEGARGVRSVQVSAMDEDL